MFINPKWDWINLEFMYWIEKINWTHHLRCSGEREMQISTCPAPFNPQAMLPLRTPRTLSTVVCLSVRCHLSRPAERWDLVRCSVTRRVQSSRSRAPGTSVVRFRDPVLCSPGWTQWTKSCLACDAESESQSESRSESEFVFGPFTRKNSSAPHASSRKKKEKEKSETRPRGKKTHSCVSLKWKPNLVGAERKKRKTQLKEK